MTTRADMALHGTPDATADARRLLAGRLSAESEGKVTPFRKVNMRGSVAA